MSAPVSKPESKSGHTFRRFKDGDHEWRSVQEQIFQGDLVSARDFTLRLLDVDESVTRRQAAAYRLARLDRKLESRAVQPALLF